MRFKLILPLILMVFGCAKAKLDPAAEALLTQLAADGDLIVATRAEAVPIDPFDPVWQSAPELQVPLVSQTSIAPRTAIHRSFKIAVRSLYNKKEIGFLIGWDDPTKDEVETGVAKFRDAVAIGFPISQGPMLPLPYIGMGNKGHPVNIWHWKASWQVDADRGYYGVSETHAGMVPNEIPTSHRTGAEAGNPISISLHKSPVENLVAEGFGTLTSTPSAGLTGKGIWKDNRWDVVVKRPRSPQGVATDLSPRNGGLVPISFSVWDGSSSERNGMKGLTRWRFLRFEKEPVALEPLKGLMINPGADPQRGKQLVSDLGCTACHHLPGGQAESSVGPDLMHAGSIHRPEYLLESIKNPNAVIVPAPGYYQEENQARSAVEGEAPSPPLPRRGGGGDASPSYDPKTFTSTMPSFGDQVPEQDYNDMVAYLRSLQ